ncbi:hypothetical protein V6N13_068915 [Hibiscus sabdariffa]
MSSIRNPSVGVELTGEGFVAGYQGGRPPDGVMVLDAPAILERQGSPVAPGLQQVPKRGRNIEEEMVIDDVTPDGERVSGGLEGMVQTPPMPEENLNFAPLMPSFRDTLLGATGALRKQSIITELDVEVKAEDVRLGGISTLPEIRFSDRVHNEHDVARRRVEDMRSERIGGCNGVQDEVAQLHPHAHLVENREYGRALLRGETSQPKEDMAGTSAVVPDGEPLEPKPAKGRVLPSSIRGVAPKGGAKKGVDLDRAEEAERNRELAERSRAVDDIAPAQWTTN